MKSNLLLGVGFVAALARPASASDSYGAKSYPRGEIRKLIVETDSGAITLAGSGDGTAFVDVAPAALPGDDCRVSQVLRGGTLRLTARAPRAFLGAAKTCSAGFAVSGAFELIEARTRSGAVVLRGATGVLRLFSGSGSISGDAPGSRVEANTGSGDVTLGSLSGIAAVRTGSGNVSLTWISAPKSGKIEVRTGSGDLTAAFPPSTNLKTDFRSGSGKLRGGAPGGAAPLTLVFRSGSGGATIGAGR